MIFLVLCFREGFRLGFMIGGLWTGVWTGVWTGYGWIQQVWGLYAWYEEAFNKGINFNMIPINLEGNKQHTRIRNLKYISNLCKEVEYPNCCQDLFGKKDLIFSSISIKAYLRFG